MKPDLCIYHGYIKTYDPKQIWSHIYTRKRTFSCGSGKGNPRRKTLPLPHENVDKIIQKLNCRECSENCNYFIHKVFFMFRNTFQLNRASIIAFWRISKNRFFKIKIRDLKLFFIFGWDCSFGKSLKENIYWGKH